MAHLCSLCFSLQTNSPNFPATVGSIANRMSGVNTPSDSVTPPPLGGQGPIPITSTRTTTTTTTGKAKPRKDGNSSLPQFSWNSTPLWILLRNQASIKSFTNYTGLVTWLCMFHLKLVSAVFIKFLFFQQMIALQKLWKVFFISSKKLLLFLRYSNFYNFFPSFPHFPDSKGQMEVE